MCVYIARSNVDKRKKLLEYIYALKKEILVTNNKLKALPIIKGTIPDIEFFSQDISKQHLSSLWMDKEFEYLRSKLFIDALALHKATIRSSSQKWINNYSAVRKMLLNESIGLSSQQRKQLWGILFFTVPVISTTLASFGRLFSGMETGSLGWLLIDEAGQATPQSVAGAIWRAKHTVIIGDPIQIKPIVTVPDALIKYRQNNKYSLNSSWSPLYESAQTLGDRTMELGTNIGTVWTGLPLRAHRRCEDPMFSISNVIAYDNQMVQANPNVIRIDNLFDKNLWFNVIGKNNHNQLVQEEINLLENLLEKLNTDQPSKHGKDINIYVISPFKVIANKCRSVLNKYKNLNIEAGTIHTFQGKEAELVILVLGSANGDKG